LKKAHFEKVIGLIETGKREGAKVLLGGDRWSTKGYFVQPTIFGDVIDTMKIATDEIFGPVLCILKFKTLEEVIERANASTYGLGAAIFTTSISSAHKFVREVEAGSVWVNTYNVNPANLPFGGYKQSGFGRDLAEEALHNYTQVKAITWRIDC